MSKKQVIYYLFCLLLASTGKVYSQQQHPLFTQYMFNGLVINPAYAGSHESLNLTALARKQWMGFEGAPSTQTFSAHAPMRNERVALGFMMMNDNIGVTHQYGFNGVYAYRIPVSEKGKLSMGLQGGVSRVISEFGSLHTKHPDDPAFSADEVSVSLVNFGTGIYYYTDIFYTGLSVPYILNNDLLQRRQMFYTAGYVFKVSRELKLKPSTLVRAMQGVPVQMDINCNVLLKEVLWFGVSYRSFSSMCLISQIQLTDQLSVGYAYDIPVSRKKTVAHGSHEFMLSYNFKFFSSNVISPRYF